MNLLLTPPLKKGMANNLPSFSICDDSDYRSFTSVESSDNESQEDFDQTTQMPPSDPITVNSLYATNSLPKPKEFKILLQTNPSSHNTLESWENFMGTGTTQKNQQEQQNQQYQNVLLENVYTYQLHFKLCDCPNQIQNMRLETSCDHHNDVYLTNQLSFPESYYLNFTSSCNEKNSLQKRKTR